ncbi:hypothetical protein MMC12_006798 [Toensbergia leucococca]|nr:hypothetical protein [Toensbergia leucococca]
MYSTRSGLPFVPNAHEAWSSNYSGWYGRATLHPSPENVELTPANVRWISSYNSMGGSGIKMALFNSSIAVDAMGRILTPADEDFVGLSDLGNQCPEAANWRVQHRATCQPFSLLHLARNGVMEETSVYGYSKTNRRLAISVGFERQLLEDFVGYERQLPANLWELFGLVEEAWTGYEGHGKNQTVLQRVKQIVDSPSLEREVL